MQFHIPSALVVAVAAILVFPAAVAAEFKVGFVDVPRVLDKAPQAEEARSRIESRPR